MRIAMGCDEATLELKGVILGYLKEQTITAVEAVDFGVFNPEPSTIRILR